MAPELFSIGPLTVYSYGLMLGIAFIAASYLFAKEFERKNINQSYATEITLLAIVFGIIGSKLFHLFEYWDEFLNDPAGMAFNPGGLTFHGGFILAVLAIWLYLRWRKIKFMYVADAAAPSLAIAYGIARVGCHLSGDGDYGLPTSLPWGTNYENGVITPTEIFARPEMQKAFPNIIDKYPDGVPADLPMHPTPIYELLAAIVIFYLLWSWRKKAWPDGQLFMIYLILSGISRFLVEFIRLNPRIFMGLSQAQVVMAGLIVAGAAGLIYYRRHPDLPRFRPPPEVQPKDEKPEGKAGKKHKGKKKKSGGK